MPDAVIYRGLVSVGFSALPGVFVYIRACVWSGSCSCRFVEIVEGQGQGQGGVGGSGHGKGYDLRLANAH